MDTRIQKLKAFHFQNRQYLPALFFVLGFLFDVFTLGRIDNFANIVQQVFYLGAVSRILYFKTLQDVGLWEPKGFWERIWKYDVEILHFFLGSLLSAYTLFYFVSASLATSLVFMNFMILVLVVNEMPLFQRQSLPIKVGIFQICILSFFSYFIPIVVQFVGLITLLGACVLSLIVAFSTYKSLLGRGVDKEEALKLQIVPSVGVVGAIMILFALKLLPPIPVSVQYMGVYHEVRRENQEYVLAYDRPFYKFWQNGAQSFEAQPGDQVVLFARIFSPANMDDHVQFHWQQKINGNWMSSDKVKIRVLGGRGQGFRAYSVKSNFEEGEWRVKIETLDGREMGRLGFNIQKVEATEFREFTFDRY